MRAPTALLLTGLVLAGCTGGTEEPRPDLAEPPVTGAATAEPDGSREAPFEGRGVIREVRDGQLVIEHGDIPGFMAAMTMQFPVAAEAMTESFAVGDEVDFAVELLEDQRYRIFRIETTGPDSNGSD